MESAVINEGADFVEAQDERPGLTAVAIGAWKQLVRAIVASRVEDVVADDRVVVGVLIDPFHTVASPDREGEGKEAVFSRNDHLLGAAVRRLLRVAGAGDRDDDGERSASSRRSDMGVLLFVISALLKKGTNSLSVQSPPQSARARKARKV